MGVSLPSTPHSTSMPDDELLQEDLLVVRESELHGGLQLGGVVHDRDARPRAEPRGLDDDREAERVLDLRRRSQRRPSGCARPGCPCRACTDLNRSLSMQSADAATPAPDVGDARELEEPLHGPVLAEGPVQDREDDVHLAERLRQRRVRRHGQAVARRRRARAAPGRPGAPSGRRGRSRSRAPRSAPDRAPPPPSGPRRARSRARSSARP